MSVENRIDDEEYKTTIDSILDSVKHITSKGLYDSTMANSASNILGNSYDGNYTITTTNGTGINHSQYHYNTGQFITSNPYTFTKPSSKVEINGEDADLKINGKSLKEFMNKVEERLLILQPDPKKLEKYEALRKAYEHYKLMEKLVGDD